MEDDYQAVLIDFDFTRNEYDIFLFTFNINIHDKDGKRHPQVHPGSEMMKEHDIFAFHHICTLFEVDDQKWITVNTCN